MGCALCKVFRQRTVRVLWLGLHATGKTTLLYNMKLGDVNQSILPDDFNVETLDMNGVQTVNFDPSLRSKELAVIRYYYPQTDALVFMFDSSDSQRLQEAVDDFFHYVEPVLEERQLPILVLANKQDLVPVVSPEEIKQAIYSKGGEAFRANTALEVFPTVATTLEGADPAFEWLTSQLALKLARESVFSPKSSASKVIHYPAALLKNSYHRVAGLFGRSGESGGGDTEEKTTSA